MKPLPRAFRRGMELLNLPPGQVAVVGDQLFTDVFGAKRLGLYAILVNPLSTGSSVLRKSCAGWSGERCVGWSGGGFRT